MITQVTACINFAREPLNQIRGVSSVGTEDKWRSVQQAERLFSSKYTVFCVR
jgi:hypothetical protein